MLTLRALSALLFAIALFLRLWFAWDGVAVCSWDDSMYREQSSDSSLTLPQVVRWIMLPTTENRIKDKTMGYHLWMVMGLRTFGWLGTPAYNWGCSVSRTERAWQVVNLELLLIQLACVYGVALWGVQDRTFAFAITTCYLICPIVFGMNRWIMTENHVMAALWMAIAMSLWVVTARQKLAPLFAAIGIGMFATTREYALPLLMVVTLGGTAALLRDRRYTAALVFLLVAASYLVCALIAALPVFELVRQKLFNPEGQKQFFNPLPAWLAHMVMESWGPGLTVVLLVGATWVTARFVRALRARRAHLVGSTVLWIMFGLLIVGTMMGAYSTIQRLVRPSIPPFIFCLAFVLVGLRVTDAPIAALRGKLAVLLVCALLGSAVLLTYHLFIRFDHGESYKPHAAFMEYYDHPLWLRPIGGQYDRHFY